MQSAALPHMVPRTNICCCRKLLFSHSYDSYTSYDTVIPHILQLNPPPSYLGDKRASEARAQRVSNPALPERGGVLPGVSLGLYCVCIYVCVYIYIYIDLFIYLFICIYIYIYMDGGTIYIYIYIYTYIYIYIYIWIWGYHIYIHTHILHIYIYIYIYTHTVSKRLMLL